MEETAMRIAVAFSESDLDVFGTLGDGWTLVGDVASGQQVGEHIRPKLDRLSEMQLSEKVKEVFLALEHDLGVDSLRGFANNFYESAVAPMYAYVKALDELLVTARKSTQGVEVWFPSRLILSSRYSAYYMAEHESQNRRFYAREDVFLPYLLDICRKHGVTPRFMQVRFGGSGFIHRPMRVAAVFAWRFLKGIVDISRQPKVRVQIPQGDLSAVTRAVGQTEFLAPFLAASGLRTSLLAAETSFGGGRNRKLVDVVASEGTNIFGQIVNLSLWDMLAHYVQTLKLMVVKPSVTLRIDGVELNLNQAITEVLAMWPEVISYREALYSAVRQAPIPRSGIMLSTEQKSPHAYADAWVAKQNRMTCVHVMQCDQHPRPLPFPVFGDYFLADSAINAERFAREWPNDAGKVKYIGSLKACIDEHNGVKRDARYRGGRWCFFAQVDDVETNREVLRNLRDVRNNLSIDVFVKLHPRDSADHYKSFSDFEFLADGDTRKGELFDRFDMAISFPSGVVMDLIFRNKPFLLLRFGKWNSANYSYIDERYWGNVFDAMMLASILAGSDSLMVEFESYRRRFFEKSGVVSDVVTIRSELLKLSAGCGESNSVMH